MRIVSWNVNGIRAVTKKGFMSWLLKEAPDILCLNETKAGPDQLPKELLDIETGGKVYKSYWATAKRKGYAGVGIYSAIEPLEVRPWGKEAFDDEGRVLIAEYDAFSLISAYFPNSQEGGKRLEYKLEFCDAMLRFCNALVKKGRHFVLCGDYNVAHMPIDLARPRENEGSPGYLPEERAWMDKFLNAGYVDTFRHFHPDKGSQYTWWSYRADSRERNVGWRIDYQCVDNAFLPNVKSAAIRADVMGSDHCPIEIELEL